MQKINRNIIMIFIFALISFMYTMLLIKVGTLGLTADSSFHFSRVEEIYWNLKSHHFFTFIASRTFNHTGVGNFLFYPVVFLYPWAFLRFLFNPITAFFMWYGFFIFCTLIIAYYSMLDFSKNKNRSLMFSLIYTIAPYHLHLGVYNYVLGEFIAYTFLPLVFLGVYHVLWKDIRKWPLLAIGISLLLYSHLLSVYLVSLLLIVLILSKVIIQRSFDLKRLLALVKSVFLCLLLSGFILVPFITDFIGKDLTVPQKGFGWLMSMQQLVEPSISNTISINRSVGIVVLITALIGWYFVKEDRTEKYIYIIGITFLFAATTVVPWQLFNHNSLMLKLIGEIQFPYRLNAYSSFFLSVIASLIVTRFVEQLKTRYLKNLTLLAFVFISFIGYYGSIQPVFDRIAVFNNNYLMKSKDEKVALPINSLVNKKNYNDIFTYLVLFGETDYYPRQATNLVTIYNQSIYDNQIFLGRKIIKVQPQVEPNTIIYTIHKSKAEQHINLPIIAYTGSVVKINGEKVSYTNSFRNTIQVKTASRLSRITVSYQPSRVYYISIVISILSWIVLLMRILFRGDKSAKLFHVRFK